MAQPPITTAEAATADALRNSRRFMVIAGRLGARSHGRQKKSTESQRIEPEPKERKTQRRADYFPSSFNNACNFSGGNAFNLSRSCSGVSSVADPPPRLSGIFSNSATVHLASRPLVSFRTALI